MEEKQLIKNRLEELAQNSYQREQYTFTDFLGLMELNVFHEICKGLSYVSYTMFGGFEECERQMIRFGNEEALGYVQDFPIACIKVSPRMKKYADTLGHRDFLGALMNLGISRAKVGDIMIHDNEGFIFCIDELTDYICSSLTCIKHTEVRCEVCDIIPAYIMPEWEETMIQAVSERVDAVIAKVYRLSRSDSLILFSQNRVFVNGKMLENNSYFLKENDIVTVRKFGKFSYEGQSGISKKGKKNIVVKMPKVL